MKRRVDAGPAAVPDRSPGRTLDRILDAPNLAHAVPRLPPELLHRVIQQWGLENCGPLVALATPGQLARLFDLDLWRPGAPGLDEQFDADRFGAWLEVLVDAGMSSAATTVAGMEVELVAAGLAQHGRVFDAAVLAPAVTLDGQEVSPARGVDHGPRCEVGGYVFSAKRTQYWDAITAVLIALAEEHVTAFDRIMRAACRLSNSRPEVDGLDDLLTTDDQAIFDLALDREARRDTQGYVPPAQARAFLEASRRIDIRHGATLPRDATTRAYFRNVEVQMPAERANRPSELPPRDERDEQEPPGDAPAETVSAIVDLLHEAGVMPSAPRALLEDPRAGAPRLARVRACLRFVQDREPEAHAMRGAELAYLANVIAAGSTIQSRTVTAEEASNAAVAVCNLGLENWPVRWIFPEDFLVRHDLVSVFQVGWQVLYEDVCMYAADRLLGVLASVACADDYAREGLETLRVTLMKHWRAGSPWEARDGLDAIAVVDTPSWAALLGLIDHFPTLHAAVGASLAGATHHVDASAFEFISENAQIREIHAFMEALPGRLRS